jgi:BirA family transcriptional regulator, biotin operon repressor / biotin---[acetyl-CoA-carboxylase] ligase
MAEVLPSWLHWLDTVPSTNSWALERLDVLQPGDVVYTPRQTAGRGQFDRPWLSPPGVVTASFIWGSIAPARQVGFSLAAGLSVIYGLEDLMPQLQGQLRLKWPNDIWYQQRKVAGILSEGRGERLVVGIGCNLRADFSDRERASLGDPVSLHQLVAGVPEPVALLGAWRRYLGEAVFLVQARGLDPLVPALGARNGLGDRWVSVETGGDRVAGRSIGFDGLGRLLLAIGGESSAADGMVAVATGRVCGWSATPIAGASDA